MQRDFHYLPVSRIKRHLLTLDEKICPSPSTESLLQLSVCDLIVTAIMMHMAHGWTSQLAYCILYVCGYEFFSIMWTVVLHARSVIAMLVLFLDHPSTDRPHFCNIVDLPLLG